MTPFNVKWFGAKGDNVTLDNVAIRAAITALSAAGGGTLFFPKGQYRISGAPNTLWLSLVSNMVVQGEGAESEIIIDAAPSDSYAGFFLKNLSNVTIRDIALTGVLTAPGGVVGNYGIGIIVRGGSNITIDNIVATNFWFDAIILSPATGTANPATNVKISNVTVSGCRRTGLAVTCADNFEITNCNVDGTSGQSPQCGIDVEPDVGHSILRGAIRGCVFKNNVGQGIYLNKALGVVVSRVVVDGNICNNNTGNGILATGADSCVLSNNVCHTNTANGIAVSGTATDISITGNEVFSNTGRGIHFTGGRRCVVSSNVAYSNTDNGIEVLSISSSFVDQIVVANNISRSNIQDGFEIRGPNIAMSGNLSLLNTLHGLEMVNVQHSVISDNFILENSQGTDVTSHGMLIHVGSSWNHIHSNTIRHSGRYHTGTAASGAASAITLDTAASSLDDYYNGYNIAITAGTGSGQTHLVSDYVGATKVLTVSAAWVTPPDGTSVFEIIAAKRHARGIWVLDATAVGNKVTDNDLYKAGVTANLTDGGTSTVTASANRT